MSRVELTERICEMVEVKHKAQLRPSTYVCLQYIRDGVCWIGVGFAKICRPDKWDSQYGYDLAYKKAIAHIARQVQGKQEQYER